MFNSYQIDHPETDENYAVTWKLKRSKSFCNKIDICFTIEIMKKGICFVHLSIL